MPVYNRNVRPERVQEKNSGVSKTETQGYIPAKTQIENLLAAGERLSEYRKAVYDFTGETDSAPIPPDRRRNFDMADAYQEGEAVKKRLKSQKKRAEEARKAEAEAELKAQEGKPEGEDPKE